MNIYVVIRTEIEDVNNVFKDNQGAYANYESAVNYIKSQGDVMESQRFGWDGFEPCWTFINGTFQGEVWYIEELELFN